MKKLLWKALGLFFVGMAYVGVITPGVPTTFFALLALWAFSKSSPKFENWVRTHKVIGKHIVNWEQKRLYPLEAKYAMMVFMFISLAFMVMFSPIWVFVFCVFLFAAIIAWAFQFPSDEWEYKEWAKRKGR